jgi:hypothetical protein
MLKKKNGKVGSKMCECCIVMSFLCVVFFKKECRGMLMKTEGYKSKTDTAVITKVMK